MLPNCDSWFHFECADKETAPDYMIGFAAIVLTKHACKVIAATLTLCCIIITILSP